MDKTIEYTSREEAERITALIGKIFVSIEETSCSYRDVICALDAVKSNYERKGSSLLDSISIQKVAEFGGLLN